MQPGLVGSGGEGGQMRINTNAHLWIGKVNFLHPRSWSLKAFREGGSPVFNETSSFFDKILAGS